MNNSIKPLLSVKTAVPELPIMTYSAAATTEISAVLAKVLSLNEFYVTTPELIAKRANIEKQLCSPGVSRDSVSCLQGLSYPLFMVIDDRSQRWVRVKVLEVSTDLKPVSAVVFKIDYGDTMKVPLANLIQLPMKFHEQGCVYKCSLPVKPVPRGRNKNTQAASEEPMHYLSALCNNGVLVDLRLFMVDNLNVHIVELFLENTTSGCTFSFEKKGWVTLSHNIQLEQCTRNR
ncbi:RING finger protein 17 [Orchesella cincta]|uniref:RING finger protein 17 n=1 Tax=Orchesella cincta TaxID=48709 RepID=A0A1D2NIT2_ORCCI|nr:RING finger protein 17 [Orchesella cincta]